MNILDRFVSRIDYASYEDFYNNFSVNVPEDFNYGFDVVDVIAQESPDKIALVWCDDKGGEATFTFKQISDYSNKAANFFRKTGIKKGDAVMLVLKRRYEFWFCLLGLHKIGAMAIPATHLLTSKDYAYRNNAADIKMIVSVAEDEVMDHIDESQEKSPTLQYRAAVGGTREGWISFDDETKDLPTTFARPTGEQGTNNDDTCPSLLYFGNDRDA